MNIDIQKANGIINQTKKYKLLQNFINLFCFNKKYKAIDNYIKAANKFEKNKLWNKAGLAYYEAAILYDEKKYHCDAANNFLNAVMCYRNIDIDKTILCLMKAIDIYTLIGYDKKAAEHYQSVAEIYEFDLENIPIASEHYEKAAYYYNLSGLINLKNKCVSNTIRCLIQLKDYYKIIYIFESDAISYFGNTLNEYMSEEYFYYALLCRLYINLSEIHTYINEYIKQYPNLAGSPKLKFINEIVEAIKKNDDNKYMLIINDYNKIFSLNELCLTLLIKIKERYIIDV